MNQAAHEPTPPAHIDKLVEDLRSALAKTNLVVLTAGPGMGAEYASGKALGEGVTRLDAQYLGLPGFDVGFDKELAAAAGPCIIGGLHGAAQKSADMALVRALDLAERGVKTIFVVPAGMRIEGLNLGAASVVNHAPDLSESRAERFDAKLSTARAERFDAKLSTALADRFEAKLSTALGQRRGAAPGAAQTAPDSSRQAKP